MSIIEAISVMSKSGCDDEKLLNHVRTTIKLNVN